MSTDLFDIVDVQILEIVDVQIFHGLLDDVGELLFDLLLDELLLLLEGLPPSLLGPKETN